MTWTWDDIQTNDNPQETAQAAEAGAAQLTEAREIIQDLLYWVNRRECEGSTTCDIVGYRRAFKNARDFMSKNDEKPDA